MMSRIATAQRFPGSEAKCKIHCPPDIRALIRSCKRGAGLTSSHEDGCIRIQNGDGVNVAK
jgi:hypothetical protein